MGQETRSRKAVILREAVPRAAMPAARQKAVSLKEVKRRLVNRRVANRRVASRREVSRKEVNRRKVRQEVVVRLAVHHPVTLVRRVDLAPAPARQLRSDHRRVIPTNALVIPACPGSSSAYES